MARMHTCTHIRARDCLRYDFKYTYENACQLSFSRLIYDANGIAWRGVVGHGMIQNRNVLENGGNVIGAFMSHSIASNSFSRIIIVIYREMAFLVPLSICRNGIDFFKLQNIQTNGLWLDIMFVDDTSKETCI